MNMALKCIITVFTFMFLSTGTYGAQAPIKITVGKSNQQHGPLTIHQWVYVITALEDDVKVKSIVVNRGRCSVNEKPRKYMTEAEGQAILKRLNGDHNAKAEPSNDPVRTDWDLNYGSILKVSVLTDATFSRCAPMEVVVKSNKGDLQFNWE